MFVFMHKVFFSCLPREKILGRNAFSVSRDFSSLVGLLFRIGSGFLHMFQVILVEIRVGFAFLIAIFDSLIVPR